MKKHIILVKLIVLTLIGSAQKLQLTEAATEFRNNYNSSWISIPDSTLRSTQLAKNTPILLKAKKAIDESYNKQLQTPFVKSKDEAKMYYYRGVIYLNLWMITSLDSNYSKDKFDSFQEIFTNSFKKSLNLDVKKQWNNFINNEIELAREFTFNNAANYYNIGKLGNSYFNFKKSIELYTIINKVDTIAMSYGASSAFRSKKYFESYELYKMLNDNEYGKDSSNIYQYMIQSLYLCDSIDEDLCVSIINEGKKKYPGDYGLSIEEYNFWLKLGYTKKANDAIQNALNLNPNNVTLQFNVGVLYDELCISSIENKNLENATINFTKECDAYKIVIKLDSNYNEMISNYLIGRLHVYLSQQIKSSNNFDGKKYDMENERADKLLLDAIPYLESQIKVYPNNENSLRVLKIIYSNLSMDSDYYRVKKQLESL